VTTHIQVDDDEYHVGTIQDITERKERERKLQLFRKAVEQAGHSVLVTDDGGEIEYVNPAFEELTGYDREDVVGESPAILSSGEHDEDFYEELWDTIEAGDVWQGEVIDERQTGEQYVVDQTIAPVENDDGEITHFVGINRDITELKEQRRELKRQNERLEQFGRTVAHDLQNPLNVMDVHLGRARRAEDPEEAHEEIQRAIDQMAALIDDLLALAKQGKTVLDPQPTDFESLVTTAWENVDTRGMTLEIDGDATFLMDDSRVREVFENLFRNAQEHAGETATVSVGTLHDGFFVEDDGPGIPDEELHQVLKSGFTTSEEGTGFGLAIVNQIAEAHDWDVAVTNGTEGGARFDFHGVQRRE
jgi:PAS domain S-box-containing protein